MSPSAWPKYGPINYSSSFDVYTDHRHYAELVGAIRSPLLEQEGKAAPNGLGAIRDLHLPGATVREQVTEYHRPAQYAYRMLSGAPLRHFIATVTFTPAGEGRTEVLCTVDMEPGLLSRSSPPLRVGA